MLIERVRMEYFRHGEHVAKRLRVGDNVTGAAGTLIAVASVKSSRRPSVRVSCCPSLRTGEAEVAQSPPCPSWDRSWTRLRCGHVRDAFRVGDAKVNALVH